MTAPLEPQQWHDFCSAFATVFAALLGPFLVAFTLHFEKMVPIRSASAWRNWQTHQP